MIIIQKLTYKSLSDFLFVQHLLFTENILLLTVTWDGFATDVNVSHQLKVWRKAKNVKKERKTKKDRVGEESKTMTIQREQNLFTSQKSQNQEEEKEKK